jgi:hypothetical protein
MRQDVALQYARLRVIFGGVAANTVALVQLWQRVRLPTPRTSRYQARPATHIRGVTAGAVRITDECLSRFPWVGIDHPRGGKQTVKNRVDGFNSHTLHHTPRPDSTPARLGSIQRGGGGEFSTGFPWSVVAAHIGAYSRESGLSRGVYSPILIIVLKIS